MAIRITLSLALAVVLGTLCSSCAGGAASFFSLDGKRTIEVRVSAGGLGEVINWKSSYEGKPVNAGAEAAK